VLTIFNILNVFYYNNLKGEGESLASFSMGDEMEVAFPVRSDISLILGSGL
jgi:hypothetical protein